MGKPQRQDYYFLYDYPKTSFYQERRQNIVTVVRLAIFVDTLTM